MAKAQVAIARRPAGERGAGPNDASGVMPRGARVRALHPTLMVLDATGAFERAVTRAWAPAGLPVVVGNPRQGRDVARATGHLAKTDAVDARALAHVVDVLRPPPDAPTPERRALLGRRQPLGGMRTAEQHRRAGPRAPHQGDRGPYDGVQCGQRHAGRRPRAAAPGQAAVASP